MASNDTEHKDIFIRNVPSGDVRLSLYDFISNRTAHLGGIQRLKVLSAPDNDRLATTVAFLRMADVEKNEEAFNLLNYSVFTFNGLKRTLYVRLNGPNKTHDQGMAKDTVFIGGGGLKTLNDQIHENDRRLADQALALAKGELSLAKTERNSSSLSCCYTRNVRPN